MPIQVVSGHTGVKQLKAAFRKNYWHYVQEAFGLGIFMISACFFGAMLFSPNSSWVPAIPDQTTRNILMGMAMGLTALFIFYSPFTSPSGSQINPAVTISFLRLGRMCRYDAFFYILFQMAGGIIAVFIMQALLGNMLTAGPVHSVSTVPGKYGPLGAAITELLISFFTMSMVLFTSSGSTLKRYTRPFAACLVCCWVVLAGPISGFSMNPARTLASSFPSGIWASSWIYLIMPFAGMLLAAECWLFIERKKPNNHYPKGTAARQRKKFMEPLEFML